MAKRIGPFSDQVSYKEMASQNMVSIFVIFTGAS
jgi:hypothetical protein